MVRVVLAILLPSLTACGGLLLVGDWVARRPALAVAERSPVHRDSQASQPAAPDVDLMGFFQVGDAEASAITSSWPRFRGANFDAVSSEDVPLADAWPASGPPVLWKVELGEGYAGAAVADGRVYVLDYDQRQRADVLRCLSLDDGREIWSRGYFVQVLRNHGMSRTTPAVAQGVVLTLGPLGHVLAVDAQSGQLLWTLDLVKQHGTKIPEWYAGQCPLIDEGKAVLAPAGDDLMIALDLRSGKELWRSPNTDGWRMTHSSIMPATIDGVKMYVYCGSGGVAGISADDGKVLWKSAAWTVNMANSPSPVPIGDGRIFLSGGYGAGSMMIRVSQAGGQWHVQELWRLGPKVFGSEQHTPVLYQDHLWGVRENGELVCLTLNGQVRWTSGRDNRFGRVGRGPYIVADGKLLMTDGDNDVAMVRASTSGFELLARSTVFSHGESWAPLALVEGRLLVRDLTTMVCLDLRKE